MRIVSYAGEAVLTTNRVGDAVVDYARALIADNSTDVVDIPVLFENEELMASMVLGPATQLIVVPARDNEVQLRDEMTIARLRAKIAALGPHRVLPIDPAILAREEQDFDYL
jgi:hypothetical protein